MLKKALSKGINVVGYDANSTPDARQWFVNQAEFNGIAKSLIDNMAKEIGEDGSFAIVTSTFTTPNQARWIAEMAAYAAKCHPNMKWLETVEAQEDNVLSFNQATTLINKHGDELKGLFGMTSVATPASAEAVTQAGKCGTIAVVGLATPNAMKPYVEKDCVKSVVLWNPVDLGYAAMQVLRAVADGDLKAGRDDGQGRQARRPPGGQRLAKSCSARPTPSPRRISASSISERAISALPRAGRGSGLGAQAFATLRDGECNDQIDVDHSLLVGRQDCRQTLDEPGLLLYRSNLLGADLRITNFGGGNTSAKIEMTDPLTGKPVTVLWVKGSGGDLGSMKLDGFATLYLDKLER